MEAKNFVLEVLNGRNKGQTFDLEADVVTIGRRLAPKEKKRDWVLLDDPSIARIHAFLKWDPEKTLYKAVLKSSSKSIVINGKTVKEGYLYHLDKLQLGDVSFRIWDGPVDSDALEEEEAEFGERASDEGLPAGKAYDDSPGYDRGGDLDEGPDGEAAPDFPGSEPSQRERPAESGRGGAIQKAGKADVKPFSFFQRAEPSAKPEADQPSSQPRHEKKGRILGGEPKEEPKEEQEFKPISLTSAYKKQVEQEPEPQDDSRRSFVSKLKGASERSSLESVIEKRKRDSEEFRGDSDSDGDERVSRRGRGADFDDDRISRRSRRGDSDREDEDRPGRRGRRDDLEEDEDRPSRRGRRDDLGEDEDRPSRRSRRSDLEEDEDRPSRRSRRSDLEEDESRPSRRSRRSDLEEDEDRPSRRSRRSDLEDDGRQPRRRRSDSDDERERPNRRRRGDDEYDAESREQEPEIEEAYEDDMDSSASKVNAGRFFKESRLMSAISVQGSVGENGIVRARREFKSDSQDLRRSSSLGDDDSEAFGTMVPEMNSSLIPASGKRGPEFGVSDAFPNDPSQAGMPGFERSSSVKDSIFSGYKNFLNSSGPVDGASSFSETAMQQRRMAVSFKHKSASRVPNKIQLPSKPSRQESKIANAPDLAMGRSRVGVSSAEDVADIVRQVSEKASIEANNSANNFFTDLSSGRLSSKMTGDSMFPKPAAASDSQAQQPVSSEQPSSGSVSFMPQPEAPVSDYGRNPFLKDSPAVQVSSSFLQGDRDSAPDDIALFEHNKLKSGFYDSSAENRPRSDSSAVQAGGDPAFFDKIRKKTQAPPPFADAAAAPYAQRGASSPADSPEKAAGTGRASLFADSRAGEPPLRRELPGSVSKQPVFSDGALSDSAPLRREAPGAAFSRVPVFPEAPAQNQAPLRREAPASALPKAPVFPEAPVHNQAPLRRETPASALPKAPVFADGPSSESAHFRREISGVLPKAPVFAEEPSVESANFRGGQEPAKGVPPVLSGNTLESAFLLDGRGTEPMGPSQAGEGVAKPVRLPSFHDRPSDSAVKAGIRDGSVQASSSDEAGRSVLFDLPKLPSFSDGVAEGDASPSGKPAEKDESGDGSSIYLKLPRLPSFSDKGASVEAAPLPEKGGGPSILSGLPKLPSFSDRADGADHGSLPEKGGDGASSIISSLPRLPSFSDRNKGDGVNGADSSVDGGSSVFSGLPRLPSFSDRSSQSGVSAKSADSLGDPPLPKLPSFSDRNKGDGVNGADSSVDGGSSVFSGLPRLPSFSDKGASVEAAPPLQSSLPKLPSFSDRIGASSAESLPEVPVEEIREFRAPSLPRLPSFSDGNNGPGDGRPEQLPSSSFAKGEPAIGPAFDPSSAPVAHVPQRHDDSSDARHRERTGRGGKIRFSGDNVFQKTTMSSAAFTNAVDSELKTSDSDMEKFLEVIQHSREESESATPAESSDSLFDSIGSGNSPEKDKGKPKLFGPASSIDLPFSDYKIKIRKREEPEEKPKEEAVKAAPAKNEPHVPASGPVTSISLPVIGGKGKGGDSKQGKGSKSKSSFYDPYNLLEEQESYSAAPSKSSERAADKEDAFDWAVSSEAGKAAARGGSAGEEPVSHSVDSVSVFMGDNAASSPGVQNDGGDWTIHFVKMPGISRLKTFDLMKDEIIIGRSSAVDLILKDPALAERHVKIYLYDGKLYLQKLDRKKQILINGNPLISSASRLLKEGDRIQLSDLTIFELRKK